jgi:hypothetical protein
LPVLSETGVGRDGPHAERDRARFVGASISTPTACAAIYPANHQQPAGTEPVDIPPWVRAAPFIFALLTVVSLLAAVEITSIFGVAVCVFFVAIPLSVWAHGFFAGAGARINW